MSIPLRVNHPALHTARCPCPTRAQPWTVPYTGRDAMPPPAPCRPLPPPQDGHTPLMVAVRTGSVELVEMLIDAGAQVDFKNEVGPRDCGRGGVSMGEFAVAGLGLQLGAYVSFHIVWAQVTLRARWERGAA